MGRHPQYDVEYAELCYGSDGRQMRACSREYDWKRVHKRSWSQVRVKHKSAQVTWDSSTKVWRATWSGVRLDNYAVLQLTVYSPKGLSTFVHDGFTGVTGRCSKGNVRFQGPRQEFDVDISV